MKKFLFCFFLTAAAHSIDSFEKTIQEARLETQSQLKALYENCSEKERKILHAMTTSCKKSQSKDAFDKCLVVSRCAFATPEFPAVPDWFVHPSYPILSPQQREKMNKEQKNNTILHSMQPLFWIVCVILFIEYLRSCGAPDTQADQALLNEHDQHLAKLEELIGQYEESIASQGRR